MAVSSKVASAFICHSSAQTRLAADITSDLDRLGISTSIDGPGLPGDTMLSIPLQKAISASSAVVLLWSREALQSRHAAAEILGAFHLNRFIIPCVLDSEPLPAFLDDAIKLEASRYDTVIGERLCRALHKAPQRANTPPALPRKRSAEMKRVARILWQGQQLVTDSIRRGDVATARSTHAALDELLVTALTTQARDDRTLLNLAGYHYKNAYSLTCWDQIEAREAPARHALLDRAEFYFSRTLFVDPENASALNGLGSILIYKNDLDAAEFFIRRAIADRRNASIDLDPTSRDLALIERIRPRHARGPRLEMVTAFAPDGAKIEV